MTLYHACMNKEKMSRPLDKEEEVPSGPLSTAGAGFEPPSKCWGVGQVQGKSGCIILAGHMALRK